MSRPYLLARYMSPAIRMAYEKRAASLASFPQLGQARSRLGVNPPEFREIYKMDIRIYNLVQNM